MKKIIGLFAMVSMACFGGFNPPESWLSVYNAPYESYYGWSPFDIYQSQAWEKRTNPLANFSNCLPSPEINVSTYWQGFHAGTVAKLIVDAWSGTEYRAKYVSSVNCAKYHVNITLKTPEFGRLTPDVTSFDAYLDLNDDGKWTAGEPYGALSNVSVGWKEVDLTFELTDTAPQTMRINMMDAALANTFEAQKSLNDRGMQGQNGRGANEPLLDHALGKNMPVSTDSETRIRIVRTKLNNITKLSYYGYDTYPNKVVLDKTRNLSVNQLFTEFDVIDSGSLDLDWAGLSEPSRDLEVPYNELTSVTYRIVFGDGTVQAFDYTNNNALATAFVNTFELGALGAQSKCVPVAPKGVVESACPTFKWKHDNTIGKAYPAFQLRVWDGNTVVYDSGAQRAPARNKDGEYSWTAPICVGMTTPQGYVFSASHDYGWSVSMLDAKFYTVNTTETGLPFSMAQLSNDIFGYGAVNVTVKYGGRNNIATTGTTKRLRVEAHTSPDFKNRYISACEITDASDLFTGASCILHHLPVGNYYVCAYLDINGNYKRDPDEPWGFATADDGKLLPLSTTVRSRTNASVRLTVFD